MRRKERKKTQPFAKSTVNKWTEIQFTAYNLCESCIIFLMETETVNEPQNLSDKLPFLELSAFLKYAKSSYSGMGKHQLVGYHIQPPSCTTHCVAFRIISLSNSIWCSNMSLGCRMLLVGLFFSFFCPKVYPTLTHLL